MFSDILESQLLERFAPMPWAAVVGVPIGIALAWRAVARRWRLAHPPLPFPTCAHCRHDVTDAVVAGPGRGECPNCAAPIPGAGFYPAGARRPLPQWLAQSAWLALSLAVVAALAIGLFRLQCLPLRGVCRGTLELGFPTPATPGERPGVLFTTVPGFGDIPRIGAVVAVVGAPRRGDRPRNPAIVTWELANPHETVRRHGGWLPRGENVWIAPTTPIAQVVTQLYETAGIGTNSAAARTEIADIATVVQAIRNVDNAPPNARRAALVAIGYRNDGQPVPGGTLIPTGALDGYRLVPWTYLPTVLAVWIVVWLTGAIVLLRRRSRPQTINC